MSILQIQSRWCEHVARMRLLYSQHRKSKVALQSSPQQPMLCTPSDTVTEPLKLNKKIRFLGDDVYVMRRKYHTINPKMFK